MRNTLKRIGQEMADIIDLDFYRKFKIVLPMRPSKLAKTSGLKITQNYTRPFRRKRRLEVENKKKEK
jgi:hypothetical protein